MNTAQFKNPWLTIMIFLVFTTYLNAQDSRSINFIGINPSLTVEPYYEKGEFDVNIFPIVYQKTISRRTDIRFSSILNLGIRNPGNEISHMGIEAALPIFLSKKENKSMPSKGFFLAPVLGLTRNRIEKHSNIGVAFEPGFNFLIDNRFGLSIGIQLGRTYFNYDNAANKWGNHFGIKVIFGKWL